MLTGPRRRRASATLGAVLTLGALLCGCASRGGLPPFYEAEQGLPGGRSVERVVFGIWESTRESDGTRTVTLRPLGTFEEGEEHGEALHVLPPLYLRIASDTVEKRTLAPLYFEDSYGTADQRERGESDDDTWLFPLFAWGSEPGTGSYFLFLPFGGTLKGKFLTDEMTFYGFPAWIETETDETRATHVLWPLLARRSGPDHEHWRALPFWSQTDTATYSRRSLLWPFVHWSTAQQGERELNGWFVFPFVGHRSASDGSSSQWTFLYPFFQFAHDDATGDRYRAVLWPFHKHVVRPGESESTWWWPFWGEYRSENERSTFYAWPIGWRQEEMRGGVAYRKTFIVPFWMHSESGPPEEAPSEEALRSWPLFSWERRADGYESVRVPQILPAFGWSAGQRTYGDLLTLFHWRKDAQDRVAWDLPFGIVRYRRDESGRAGLTLLWWLTIPMGGGDP